MKTDSMLNMKLPIQSVNMLTYWHGTVTATIPTATENAENVFAHSAYTFLCTERARKE